MATLVLTVAQKRRLDGFQSQCLRKITGIEPSYISRISNAAVLAKACHLRATDITRKKRLQLFGKILRSEAQHPLRRACFIPNTLIPVTEQFVRRVGRPCKEWVPELIQEAAVCFGSLDAASALAQHKPRGTVRLKRNLVFNALPVHTIFSRSCSTGLLLFFNSHYQRHSKTTVPTCCTARSTACNSKQKMQNEYPFKCQHCKRVGHMESQNFYLHPYIHYGNTNNLLEKCQKYK